MLINLSDVLSEQHKTVDETVFRIPAETIRFAALRTTTFRVPSPEENRVPAGRSSPPADRRVRRIRRCRNRRRSTSAYSCGYRVMYSDSM